MCLRWTIMVCGSSHAKAMTFSYSRLPGHRLKPIRKLFPSGAIDLRFKASPDSGGGGVLSGRSPLCLGKGYGDTATTAIHVRNLSENVTEHPWKWSTLSPQASD